MNKRYWLEKLRTQNGWTHDDVASMMDISRQYYGMIEKGDRTPSVPLAKKLGKLFGVDWTIFYENKSYKTLRKINSA